MNVAVKSASYLWAVSLVTFASFLCIVTYFFLYTQLSAGGEGAADESDERYLIENMPGHNPINP